MAKLTLKRRYVQLLSALLYNANLRGFADGRIFQGAGKGICVPGLNCYSCPGAVGACPLGSLQTALYSRGGRVPYYVLGMLLLFGLLLGRVICGFLCPFGLVQELLHKIPGKKLKKSSWTRRLSRLKYAVLAAFVLLLPLTLAVPGFCKYICPAGTLFGGVPLSLANDAVRGAAGWLFGWKTAVLLMILVLSVPVYRVFCRFLCPLGAIYSLFAKLSLLGIEVKEDRCDGCGICHAVCPVDIRHAGDGECIACGKCVGACPHSAIQWKSLMKGGKRKC